MTWTRWALCAVWLVGCGDDGGSGSPASDGGVDAGADPDGGVMGEIVCGGSLCDLGAEVCCATAGEVTTFGCLASGAACAGGVAACDGADDCEAGEACCIRFGGGALPDSACEAASTCTGAGTSVACATVDDCPGGQVCCLDDATGYSAGFCWPTACP